MAAPTVESHVRYGALTPEVEELDPITPSSSSGFNPPVRILLELMDIDEPAPNFKYTQVEKNFLNENVRGIRDVYRLPRMVLATFEPLGWYGADRLHKYIEERLMPLLIPGWQNQVDGKREGRSMVDCTEEAEGHVADHKREDEGEGRIPSSWKGKGRLLKEESKEVIIEWLSEDENETDALQAFPPLDDGYRTVSESSESLESVECIH